MNDPGRSGPEIGDGAHFPDKTEKTTTDELCNTIEGTPHKGGYLLMRVDAIDPVEG